MPDHTQASQPTGVEQVPAGSQSNGRARRDVRLAFLLLLFSSACIAAGFIGVTWWCCVSVPLAPLSALGAVTTARRLKPTYGAEYSDAAGVVLGVRNWLTVFGIAAFVGSVFLALASLGVARVTAKSAVSWANLREIGMAVKEYCKEHGDYPQTLHVLIDAGLVTPKQLYAPPDAVREADVAKLRYSSYAYHAGRGEWRPDPDLILAYERLPFSMVGGSAARPVRAQGVLFGDGDVRPLTLDEMQQAILRDRQRRIELGWPLGP